MPDPRRPIRTLRVIARMNLGGPAHHVALLSGRLDPERYEMLLVTGHVGEGEEEYAALDGITLRRIDSLGSEIRPWQDLKAFWELVAVIRRFKPAILETHTAKAGLLGRTAALFARSPRPVVLHTYHGHVLRGYFGPVKTQLFRFLEWSLAKRTDRLIGVSPATVDELVELGVAPRSKFSVLPLGLELAPFLALDPVPAQRHRAELGVGPDEVLFTYTGRLVPIKRPDRMLRAVALAREQGAPIRVAVVGDGELRVELEGLARELGCAGAVSFLGYRRGLTRIAAASDAALLTSDNEGTPVSLIEAAAAGRASVATAVGGVSDIVVEGAGLLARPDDEATLARHMVALAEDAELRRQMGERAREHVRKKFAVERLIRDIDSLYAELLEARATA
jgi:glycosyltransferase involved in cell wall biosynthesis